MENFMICLIAGTRKDAEKWARAQNLRSDEWFHPDNVFAIYAKRCNFHTILVHEGIDNISNHDLNLLLTAAWECGKRR
jgi:hypothetical protein